MRILKHVSSISSGKPQALVPSMLVLIISMLPLITVQARDLDSNTPTVVATEPSAVQPAPSTSVPEPPLPVAPAPVEPVPVAPAPVPVEPVPVESAPTELPVSEAAEVPAIEPVIAPVVVDDVAIPEEQDVDTGESEEDPAETSGNDPGGEAIVTPETPVQTVVATESPTPTPITAATPTPSPTAVPSPTPEPIPVITWSQPDPVSCVQHAGNAQSLSIGDIATWRCQVSITAEVTGETPEDLHVIWEIDASYAGDDVRLSLPSGSAASVLVPDSNPGGTSELVTYRTNWTGGQTLTFDVTISRTSCVVGEAQLTLHADVDVKSADESLQITRSGKTNSRTHLVSVSDLNPETPVVAMEPVNFGALQWNGESWGTAYATTVVEIANNGCPTSHAYEIQVDIVAKNPALTPVVSTVNVPGSALAPAITFTGIAYVPAGFEGSAQVEVTFALSPTVDAGIGKHSFGFDVAVVAAP